MPAKIQWTITIIMVTDGLQWFEYNDLEQSILETYPQESTRYVILYYDQSTKTIAVKEIAVTDEDTYQFFYSKPPEAADIYKPETLTRLLKDYVTNKFTDSRHLIITWGHGAGLGYFSLQKSDLTFLPDLYSKEIKNGLIRQINQLAVLKSNHSIDYEKWDWVRNNNFNLDSRESYIYDFITRYPEKFINSLKLLTAEQIGGILKGSFPQNRKIEVLIAINCYNQLIDGGQDLSDKVNLLVAPQTLIPFTGINYLSLFKLLIEYPDSTPQEISDNITRQFNCKYTDTVFKSNFKTHFPGFDLTQTSISANDLALYFNISSVLKLIFELFLSKVTPDLRLLIKEAREKCNDLSKDDNHGVIDLSYFLENISILFNNPANAPDFRLMGKEFEVLYNNYLLLKKQCNLSILRANKKYYPTPENSGKCISPLFLSIFYPVVSGTFQRELIEIYKSSFGSANGFRKFTRWDEFLDTFF